MLSMEQSTGGKKPMKKIERILIAISLLLMCLTFFLPLWRIEIWAPQYPEGLFMEIGLSRISGSVDQINILNHYIGMKPITPSSIPELRLMPGVMAGLITLGVLALILGRRWIAKAWFVIFVVAASVGMYDFYRWGYDYGHDLNPDAPIKVPGMEYQPPLLGHKALLNIDAYSFPHIGGIALAVAIALVAVVLLLPKFKIWSRLSVLLLGGMLLSTVGGMTACTRGPEQIESGKDTCASCQMQISDLRFGGEIITRKGRAYKFDAMTCLLRFEASASSDVKSIWVLDYLKPGTFVEAKKAHFLKSDKIRGPMGADVIASADEQGLKSLQTQFAGELLQWDQVKSALQGKS